MNKHKLWWPSIWHILVQLFVPQENVFKNTLDDGCEELMKCQGMIIDFLSQRHNWSLYRAFYGKK